MGKVLMKSTCKLIVWDECTMTHKKLLEALHRTLQDLRGRGGLAPPERPGNFFSRGP